MPSDIVTILLSFSHCSKQASRRQETEINKKAFRNYFLSHKPYVKYVSNAFESHCFRALFQVTPQKYLLNVEMEVIVLHRSFSFFSTSFLCYVL